MVCSYNGCCELRVLSGELKQLCGDSRLSSHQKAILCLSITAQHSSSLLQLWVAVTNSWNCASLADNGTQINTGDEITSVEVKTAQVKPGLHEYILAHFVGIEGHSYSDLVQAILLQLLEAKKEIMLRVAHAQVLYDHIQATGYATEADDLQQLEFADCGLES